MQKAITLMQVLRVPPMGKLVVAVKKERYESLTEIDNPTVRQALLAAIGELVSFAGGYQELVDQGLAPALRPAAPPAEPDSPLTPEQARFVASLEAERDALREAEAEAAAAVLADIPDSPEPDPQAKPQPPAPEKPAPAASPPVAASGGQPRSLVEQIDAILQKHVSSETAMAERSIHLVQAPSGGIKIDVDGRLYDKPNDIEETAVQMIIKRALKEWEST